jgi:hypothetical protein
LALDDRVRLAPIPLMMNLMQEQDNSVRETRASVTWISGDWSSIP